MTSLAPVWRFPREWLLTTLFAAVGSTTIDAVLLDRKFGLFRGGFLAEAQLDSVGSSASFLIASLGIDAAACAIPAAFALLLTARFGLGPLARVVAAGAIGVLPTLVTNIVAYEIVSYLGDVANLRILYQLTGHSTQELLAVGVAQAWWLGGASVVALAAFGILLHLLHRFRPGPGLSLPRVSLGRVTLHTVSWLLVGTSLVAAARLSDPAFDRGVARKPTGRFFSWIVQRLTDVDRDGYGLLSKPADPAPWDARVYPYAVDVPGNGIDEDGLAGDLPAGLPAYDEGPSVPPRWTWKPVFVLAVLETFRGDLIDLHYEGREVTPTLNALAREGVALEQAYSHNGFTVQSRFHIFTGSLARQRGGTSLIDDFKANGYQTAFFSAQDESFGDWLDVGFKRADVRYDARQDVDKRFSQFATPGSLGIPAELLRDRIRAFLESRDTAKPLFLTLNFQDTHFPYGHRFVPRVLNDVRVGKGDMRQGRAADIRAMYLNTAAYVDRTLGEVLRDIERTTGQVPVVVALGDHGESLFEEGFLGHGYAANEVQTRIVFVARGLPVTFVEPFGQKDLRDAIWDGLSRTAPARPTRRTSPGKSVVQYVGDFSAPAQIALRRGREALAFDLRVGHARILNGSGTPAVEPPALPATAAEDWRELIWTWERARMGADRVAHRPPP